MKILLCDDEPLARQRLRLLIEQEGKHTLVGEIEDGAQLLSAVNQLNPDIVLLDISMAGLDGIQAADGLQKLANPPAVIFCTAHDNYALDAFGVHAVGYLLKPIKREELHEALQHALTVNRAQSRSLQQQERMSEQFIVSRSHRGLERIPLSDVLAFNADHKYVQVLHRQGEVLIDEPLKELEKRFSDYFVRVHRSTLVRVDVIKGLRAMGEGKFAVELEGTHVRMPVSRRHLPAIRQIIRAESS